MKWIKAIDDLPKDRKNYNGKLNGQPVIVHDWKLAKGYITANGNLERVEDVEWLDDSNDDAKETITIGFIWDGDRREQSYTAWIKEDDYKGFVAAGNSVADCLCQLGISLHVKDLYEAEKAGLEKPLPLNITKLPQGEARFTLDEVWTMTLETLKEYRLRSIADKDYEALLITLKENIDKEGELVELRAENANLKDRYKKLMWPTREDMIPAEAMSKETMMGYNFGCTVRDLKEFFTKYNMPDTAPLVVQRIFDWYYTNNHWKSYFKYHVQGGQQEYHPAFTPVWYPDDPEILFINLHY